MFSYEKMLQYPVNIKNPNPKYAQIVLEQYGGPDGELGASLRYLSQRFSMPYPELKGLLTDIGTEELGHLEMIGAIYLTIFKVVIQDFVKIGHGNFYIFEKEVCFTGITQVFHLTMSSINTRFAFLYAVPILFILPTPLSNSRTIFYCFLSSNILLRLPLIKIQFLSNTYRSLYIR